MKYITTVILLIFLSSCSSMRSYNEYNLLKTFSKNGHLQMVVEIPAGTNKKYEYDYKTRSFKVDIKNGQDRIIKFLPYPANYGFIPSTKMEKERGGDGDALDVLLISEYAVTGSVLEIVPIAILVLEDGGENDSKIIAVPLDKKLRVIDIDTYNQLDTQYPKVKYLIQEWFLNYKEENIMQYIEWKDELHAKAEIYKWRSDN
tara:strand:+ start:216 stop:821 length:606 start_codon:yes stop_codon:yes gene_type:complete